MEFTTDVVSQVILLTSILGGFSLTTAAQIALKEDASAREKHVANALIRSFTSSLIIIVLGILNMAATDPYLEASFAAGMVFATMFTIANFIAGAAGLFSEEHGLIIKSFRFAALLEVVLVTIMVFLFFAIAQENRRFEESPLSATPIALPTVSSEPAALD